MQNFDATGFIDRITSTPPRAARPAPTASPVATIRECVARSAGLSVPELLSGTKQQPAAGLRHVAMYLTTRLCPTMTLAGIAEAFGYGDKTIVVYARRSIAVRIADEPEFARSVKRLEREILGELQQSGAA